MDIQTFGSMVRAHRRTLGLEQQAMAAIFGCSKATLSKIELGKQAAKAPLVLRILSTLSPQINKELQTLQLEVNKQSWKVF